MKPPIFSFKKTKVVGPLVIVGIHVDHTGLSSIARTVMALL